MKYIYQESLQSFGVEKSCRVDFRHIISCEATDMQIKYSPIAHDNAIDSNVNGIIIFLNNNGK